MSKKISQLTQVSSLAGTELLPVVQSGSTKSATVQQISGANSNYYTHIYAGQQLATDTKAYDISGAGNDGTFGANLSAKNAWVDNEFLVTINPFTAFTDSVVRLPNINFDYNAGEIIIGMWIGRITPEGSAVEFLGDGGFSVSFPGWSVRVTTTGKVQLKLADGTNTYFSGTTTATAFDGTVHSVGFVINGVGKNAYIWVDEVLDVNGTALNSGNPIDTRNSNTVNIGSSLPASAASTTGIATQTNLLALLRLSAGKSMPSTAALTSMFQALRRNPEKLVKASVFE
jgi:hypothetical protein